MRFLSQLTAAGLIAVGVLLTLICVPFVLIAGIGINAANFGLETLARMRREE